MINERRYKKAAEIGDRYLELLKKALIQRVTNQKRIDFNLEMQETSRLRAVSWNQLKQLCSTHKMDFARIMLEKDKETD